MIPGILFLVCVIAAIAVGWGAGAWQYRRAVEARQVKPVCGCEHHRAMHDPKTNACHGKEYEGGGVYSRCTCRQYVGPEPLPSYYAPEIDSGSTP
jgi:hypothetical protein